MKAIKKLITAFVCLLLPNRLFFWLLNLLGHKVHPTARVGFSLVLLNGKLELGENSRIGHFNLIRIDHLRIDTGGYIGRFCRVSGPFDIVLHETAALGNGIKASRAPLGTTYGRAVLELGILSKLTANHRVDCTRSILIGNYSTLAGQDSQLWTHGYYHDKEGPGRFRIDGEIHIGNNVYLGSRCVVNAGVKIADAVTVGSNACVSRSLTEPGSYVNQALRYIDAPETDPRSKFSKIEGHSINEEVYEKKL